MRQTQKKADPCLKKKINSINLRALKIGLHIRQFTAYAYNGILSRAQQDLFHKFLLVTFFPALFLFLHMDNFL